MKLHLLEGPPKTTARFQGPGAANISEVRYDEAKERIYIGTDQYFGAVPVDVCEYVVGGHQVCEKWLQDRQG